MIEEIAVSVIGADYKDYIFYESLEAFIAGYGIDSPKVEDEITTEEGGKVVKLRDARRLFIPPESVPDTDVDNGD